MRHWDKDRAIGNSMDTYLRWKKVVTKEYKHIELLPHDRKVMNQRRSEWAVCNGPERVR